MVLVEVTVQVPQRAMICTMLGPAVEAFLMSALMRFVHLSMEPIVRRMIAGVSAVGGVRVIVGRGRRGCGGQGQRGCCHQGFRHSHGGLQVRALQLIER
jgi:hypothetical protein